MDGADIQRSAICYRPLDRRRLLFLGGKAQNTYGGSFPERPFVVSFASASSLYAPEVRNLWTVSIPSSVFSLFLICGSCVYLEL
jgi:hypothetical protein